MRLSLHAVVVLSLAAPLAAQDSLRNLEFGVFGGPQIFDLWRSKFNQPGSEIVSGGLLGARVGHDLTRRFGLEGSYGYGVNNLRLFPDQRPRQPGNIPTPRDVGFGARNHHLAVNPVFHFTSPDARIRPYVTAGIGSFWYRVTDDARRDARLPNNAYLAAQGLNGKFGPAFNWGGGIKAAVGRGMQLRFDLRDVITRNPHFNIPDAAVAPGAAFIAPKGLQSGLQATVGIGMMLGDRLGIGGSGAGASGSAASQRGKGKIADRVLSVKISPEETSMKVGANRGLSARTNAMAGSAVNYQWSIKSPTTETTVRDVTGPEYTFDSKDRTPGDYKVTVTATSPDYPNPASDTATIRVLPLDPLPLSVGAEPTTINPGQNSGITGRADVPPGTKVTYRWTVNGVVVEGADGPTYLFDSKGRQPGTYEICANAEADGYTASKQCTTVVIRDCSNPSISLSPPSASEIWRGEPSRVSANAQQGNCASPVNVSYSVSEGSISQDGTFNSSDVGFDMANRSRLQRKTVTVTATAKDGQGKTASATTNIVVKLAPVAQRLDDILFPSGSSRVNNCGKRVLLEALAPKLKEDPEATVLLIGHVDEREPGAKSRTRALDKARVLSAAAVVSAGQGICPALELSRVKVAYAGTKAPTDPKPNFCEGSTERRGQQVRQSERAAFRSVEVWLIPSGAALPAGVTPAAAPEADIKKLGCPR